MPQPTRVQSPLRGVNRAFSREAQPDGSVYDALNVLPFDRYDRLRAAQRTGYGELIALDAAAPVRLLHMASSARTPGGGSSSFTPAVNPEFLDNYETDTPADAATFHPGTRGNVGISDSSVRRSTSGNTNFAKISTVGGQTGLRGIYPGSLSFGDAHLAYVLSNMANGDSTTWLAASDSIWFEMGVRWRPFDGTPTGQSPYLGMVLGIPVSDLSVNNGTACPTVIYVSFFPHDDTGELLTDADIAVGTASTSLAPTTVLAPYTFTSTQDYKLIVAVTATTLNVFVDDYATITLIQQFSMSAVTPTLANIIDGTAGPELASEGGITTGGRDTVKYFSVSQAQSVPSNISRTALQLVATSGAQTYIGQPTTMAEVVNDASYPIDANAIFVSAATLFNYTYIVDGTSIHRLNLASNLYETLTEVAGTAPTDCTIAASWRGRLILSGASSDPQNLFASRAGNPLDWDYSQEDPAAAFVLNAAASGKIGQPIHALIPITDDIMLIGCEQSVYRLRGDPADGGSCDLISDTIGVSSQTAWCRLPTGETYWVGPRGLYKASPTGDSVVAADLAAYPQFFQGINRSTNYINLIYDADRYGIWIYIAPIQAGNIATFMFYDIRVGGEDKLGGFWPQRLTNMGDGGPVTAVFWDGYDSDNRYPIIGGYVGGLFATNNSNRSDNGGIIDAFVILGPFHPNEGESLLSGTTFDFGELSTADASTPTRWQASVTLKSGKTAYDVTEGTPTSKALVSIGRDRRSKTIRQRLKGEWFTVMISDGSFGNYFTLESVQLQFEPLGANRRQR